MPKRDDINSVLVIGSGPIVIGQAAEFDYSGTQACRVLRSEGVRVVLVNSNPATIMTDPDFADATYIEPITWEVIESIIAKERPDAILPTLGGQTALNAAIQLHEHGVLDKYGVELIGASFEAINKGEDRQLFKNLVLAAGAEVAKSFIAHTVGEAIDIAEQLGYPLVIRPSFTMGGLGSGFAYDRDELIRMVTDGLHQSPTSEVLLEESILGWKEYELELMRDTSDNTVVVCSIENVDPVGVHTGDSITVAPALTLTDREYQNLRDIGIDIIRAVGVDTGGCNIQFAVNPADGRVIVIEMNPRVSRSSALASKATGFPIAKIAAMLAIGYRLDEIPNDITKVTPACFEPTLDYVVVKVPRFAFEKFPMADTRLTTTMKSVGEAMAIGRNFSTALQKALRSLEKRGSSFHWHGEPVDKTALLELASVPTDGRIVTVQQAMRAGATIAEVHAATGIDPWFVDQIALINEVARRLDDGAVDRLCGRRSATGSPTLRSRIAGHGEDDVRASGSRSVSAVFKTVDTCAAEFAAHTPYHYSAYDEETEVTRLPGPGRHPRLRTQPHRPGHRVRLLVRPRAMALSEVGYETIMVNCNPETVSTDYDTSDRLYFEPLTLEDVLEIIHAESQSGELVGVIVQLGGQTALGLAQGLKDAGVPILGTSPEAIDLAEERGLFSAILADAGLQSPKNGTATDAPSAVAVAESIGYPVLVRPSYVLGGRGMEIIYDTGSLEDYFDRVREQAIIGPGSPLLVDRFLDDAIEIDIDAIYDGTELYVGGIMEHIEEAGIHSGDSACTLPPVTLGRDILDQVVEATEAIARGIGVRGLINVQFAIGQGTLYVLEANPRASRTVPFVSKALGIPLAKAASLRDGRPQHPLPRARRNAAGAGRLAVFMDSPVSVKEAVLPFKRFRTAEGHVVDSVLGPEMRSTGEVMGIDRNFPKAFTRARRPRTAGCPRPVRCSSRSPTATSARSCSRCCGSANSASASSRPRAPPKCSPATASRPRWCASTSWASRSSKVSHPSSSSSTRGRWMSSSTRRAGAAHAQQATEIRTATVAADKPLFTTIAQLGAAVASFEVIKRGFEVRSLQDYAKDRAQHLAIGQERARA